MTGSVLVLNASYEYLNVTSLKRAVKLLYKEKAEVVEEVDGRCIRSIYREFGVPSIIRMLYYIKRPFKEVPLTRKNVLARDSHTCQYCGKTGDTVDHIKPRSRGGVDSWTNCVCACAECNRKKNNRTPDEAGMALARRPRKPSHLPWMRMRQGKNSAHKAWARYLFWGSDG